ncbi:hypothetical protein BGZ91_002254, partial [Linnemannia elongata]
MTAEGGLLQSQYEREREKNLLENQLMLTQLFGTMTPAVPERRIINKLLTSKEVDALEQLNESKKSNSVQPPYQPVRFVFDHIYISRRTSRQAAQKKHQNVKMLSSRRSFYSRDQKGKQPVDVLSKEVRKRRAKLLAAGRVNHCHLCANYMKAGCIPCSSCDQRFHYICLKRRLKVNANRFTENWLCPICCEVCNCDDCWDSEWKHSNGPVRQLQSSDYNWRRGSEDTSGDEVDADQGGQKDAQRRSQRKQLRSIVGVKQNGWENVGSRLSCREQPRRAAAKAARGRFQEVEYLSESEDDWIAPSTRGPKRERETEQRTRIYVDAVESGEDGDE